MLIVTSTSTGKTSLSLDWSLMVGIFVLRNAWFDLHINFCFSLRLLWVLGPHLSLKAGMGEKIKHHKCKQRVLLRFVLSPAVLSLVISERIFGAEIIIFYHRFNIKGIEQGGSANSTFQQASANL